MRCEHKGKKLAFVSLFRKNEKMKKKPKNNQKRAKRKEFGKRERKACGKEFKISISQSNAADVSNQNTNE
jgi:hypothetical protein